MCFEIGHQYSMTHTQLHSLHGQPEAMTQQNHKYSHKLLINAQRMARGQIKLYVLTKPTNIHKDR